MILNKWNYEKHNYEDYEVPNYWNVVLYSNDMEEIINCPHCGEEIEYGESYTSLEFHSHLGLGYSVCEECYNKEWDKRRKYREV